MLSRVADSLYWMSRYLERAEHVARLLDVQLHQMLDQPESADMRWQRLLTSLRVTLPDQTTDPYRITQALTFDTAISSSIVACIGAARENARQVREQISSEMWEQLNSLSLQIRRTSMDQIWNLEPHEFFRSVKEGAHLFQGITDSTMRHGEGWQFIQVGRYIERATATAVLLDTYFGGMPDLPPTTEPADNYLEWVGLLKCCTAFEAYSKVYTADVQPRWIAEFLLLDAEFPRSVRFAADMLRSSLRAISASVGSRAGSRLDRLAGRLCAALDYGQVDEIMAESMHAYLESIQRQCGQIHTTIHQTYISYPVDVALAG